MTAVKISTSKKTAALIAAFVAIFAMLSIGATPAFAVNYTISGTVTNSSGSAISGATVTASASGQADLTATTDVNGAYTIAGALDATTWTLKFSKVGFATEYFDNATTAAASTGVALAGANATGKDASLAAEAVISGVTYNTSSAVLPSATVTLYLDGVQYATTTSDGTTAAYSFNNLPAGSYSLGFSKTGYVTQYSGLASTLSAATPFNISAGSTTAQNVSLVSQGTISGTTTPGGVSVVIRKADGTQVATATSAAGATGAYSIANLNPGTYYAEYSLSGYITEWWNDSANFLGSNAITVTAGGTTSAISPTLVASPGAGTVESGSATATITGTPAEGQTLTANSSGWTTSGTLLTYQWQISANGTNGWAPITDAVLNTYVVQAADATNYLRVLVTGNKLGYVASASIASASTAVVTHAFTTAPLPTISGTPAVGQTLTASTGTWAPTPTSFTYQWYRNTTAIAVATTSSYTPTIEDVAYSIYVKVTAVKAGYPSTERLSAGTSTVGALMTVTPTPTISGVAAVGRTLSVSTGVWNPSSVSFTYQWYRSGNIISGATGSTYSPVAADVGNRISVTVQATASGYTATTISSAATDAVIGQLTKVTPLISGGTTIGSVIGATPGAWGPGTVAFTYQWFRNGVAIAGATASTYTLTADDDAKTITVTVTGTASGYDTASATSAGFLVGKQFALHPTPTIKGNLYLGQTLTATVGTWDTGAALAYQWYRDGSAIAGATARTYKLPSTAVGRAITFSVTATAAGFVPKTETSAATALILNGKPFTKSPVPTITGNAHTGATLTANVRGWAPVATKVSYQWLRGGAVIAGANKASYKATSADKGYLLSVRIVATKSGFATTTRTSKLTSAIK